MPVSRAVLHFGSFKTGSTAIQESLFFRLRDPRFQYVSGGYSPNGSWLVEALFHDPPESENLYDFYGRPNGPFSAYRRNLEERLERAARSARENGRDVILSSEATWFAPRPVLERVRDHFARRGFEPTVVGYLRPWSSWLPSFYQEDLKNGAAAFEPVLDIGHLREGRIVDVRSRIEILFDVFGRERVSILRFDPASFPDGCVVRHFCDRIGFRVPPDFRQRSNEGLSLPAVQFLRAFNLAGGGYADRVVDRWKRASLIERDLQGVPGPRFRFHPSLVRSWLAEVPGQDEWLEREVGFGLEDASLEAALDDPDAVRREEDLAAFSEESLDWLAARTGGGKVRGSSTEETVREVARRVSLLPGRVLPVRQVVRRLRIRAAYAWVHRRYGC